MGFRIVKYKIWAESTPTRYQLATDQRGKVRSSGWLLTTYEGFREIMSRLNPRVRTVAARILETADEKDWVFGTYKLVGAWDWIRFGIIPKFDVMFKQLSAEKPERYKLSRHGIWCRRDDLYDYSSDKGTTE